MGFCKGIYLKNCEIYPVCKLPVIKKEPHETRGAKRYHKKCFESLYIVSKEDA
jgi:hypothetical protein